MAINIYPFIFIASAGICFILLKKYIDENHIFLRGFFFLLSVLVFLSLYFLNFPINESDFFTAIALIFSVPIFLLMILNIIVIFFLGEKKFRTYLEWFMSKSLNKR